MSDGTTLIGRHGDRIALAAILALALLPGAYAQDRDRDRDRDWNRDRFTHLEPGTVIPVRTTERIDVDRRDRRVYPGVVDQDVR
jgi:hypothetical protein